MNRLKYCVTQSGYSAKLGNGVISQKLDGGASRYRRSLKNPSHSVSVQWVVGEAGYQYLMAFYRVWRRNPNQAFLAKLVIDDTPAQDYQCYFADSPALSSKQGLIFTVSAQLEVKPLKEDETFDDFIVSVADDSNGALWDWVNPLDELVNIDLPNALGES